MQRENIIKIIIISIVVTISIAGWVIGIKTLSTKQINNTNSQNLNIK